MDKLTKKELKTPDQIWQVSRSTFDWLLGHWLPVVAILSLGFVIAVGVLVTSHFQNQDEAKAQFHLSKAQSLYSQWELQTGTEKEKTFQDLQKELTELGTNFSSSRANQFAELWRAQIAADSSNLDQAIKHYQTYVGVLPAREKPMGLYPLAITLEQKGDWNAALENFEKILKVKDSSFEGLALLGKARAQRELKKLAEAAATYKSYLDKFPQAPDVGEVRGLLASLPAH